MPGTSPTETESRSVPGTALQGIVHGGQQPIVGAHVYLYAANTTGYGSASVSLLASTGGTTQDPDHNYYVTTQSGGTFSITGDYSCPSAGSQVYLYAMGGNPGLGQGTNAAIGLIAGLGTCGSLSSSTYAVINEVSTIATAYAIAGFATDATHVSSSSTALATATDLPNAFATVANLESLSQGVALAVTPAGNGTVPQAEIYTLADILAACVNSSGPSSTPCSSLFSAALSRGTTGSQPSDTATAAINIAHNPGSNVSTIYGLMSPNPVFGPRLGSAPNDFTIAITYSGDGLDGTGFAPEGIAIDGAGNVWVPNYDSSSISVFSSNGVAIDGSPLTAAGLNQPTSIAIDEYGNAWASNFNGDDVSEFNAQGQKISNPPGWVGGGLNKPYGIAIDNVGHAWIANFGGNSMSEFSSSLSFGLAISPSSGFGSDTLVGPAGIASDTSGNVWTANYTAATSSIAEAVPSSLPGQPPTFTLFTGGGLNSPYGVAIDGSGNVWATNRGGGGSISESTSSGQPVSGAGGYSGGGISGPYGIAIDGAGNVWTANNGGNSNSISEFNSSGTAISGANGYISNGLLEPYGIAIDGSGNVWVASDNTSGPLTEFVGTATPVVTPISAGTAYKQLGARP